MRNKGDFGYDLMRNPHLIPQIIDKGIGQARMRYGKQYAPRPAEGIYPLSKDFDLKITHIKGKNSGYERLAVPRKKDYSKAIVPYKNNNKPNRIKNMINTDYTIRRFNKMRNQLMFTS